MYMYPNLHYFELRSHPFTRNPGLASWMLVKLPKGPQEFKSSPGPFHLQLDRLQVQHHQSLNWKAWGFRKFRGNMNLSCTE